MIEKCEWKFNALKTYLRVNVIHLNASKIEKFKIRNFFTSFHFNQPFCFYMNMAELRGPYRQNTSHILPLSISSLVGTELQRLNASLLVPQEIHGRVLKWNQLFQAWDEPLSQNHTLPYPPLFLFVSNTSSKRLFCFVHWDQWSQLVASTLEFDPLWFFFALYISYIMSC